MTGTVGIMLIDTGIDGGGMAVFGIIGGGCEIDKSGCGIAAVINGRGAAGGRNFVSVAGGGSAETSNACNPGATVGSIFPRICNSCGACC